MNIVYYKLFIALIFPVILLSFFGCTVTSRNITPTPSITPTLTPVFLSPTPEPVHSYQLGTIINFDRNGKGKNYLVTGWDEPGETFTATGDKKSELLFQIDQKEITCDVIMRINLTPCVIEGKITSQRVYIYANDRKIGEWIATSPGEYKIIIPEVCLMDPLLRIILELPDAISPDGKEGHKAGILLNSMVLMEIYRPGEKIMFIKGGNSEFYKGTGWSNPEENFTWTEGKKSEINIPSGNIKGDLILKVFTGGLVSPGIIERQTVNIYINGNKIGSWIVKEKKEYSIKIPEKFIIDNKLNIVFELPDASVPKILGLNKDDTRMLGLCVEYIMLDTSQ